jgi:hypothetical protein
MKLIPAKITYTRAHNVFNFRGLSEYHHIFPSEAMTGNLYHDYALYCTILTAAKLMTPKELKKVADFVHWHNPGINYQVVNSCRRIIDEGLGYTWEK